jgi:hypothetical protein
MSNPGSTAFDKRDNRFAVEKWVNSQPTCPSRKEVQEQFPDVQHRVIKAVLQSRKDREAKG